jgi:hypothetical protein
MILKYQKHINLKQKKKKFKIFLKALSDRSAKHCHKS